MAERNPSAGRLAWEYLAHSEIGLVRKNNQDSGLVSARLLMVADGMGGAAAGDLASAVAVESVAQTEREAATQAEREPGDRTDQDASGDSEHDPDAQDRLRQLAGAISTANTRIADLVATDYALEGMGTTVTAAVLDGNSIGVAHIGDSRGYLFRSGELSRLTHDHSWVQSLIDDGKINEEEAATHPHRSLLLKVLNGQPANEPDLSTVPVRPGDRLLLCSDGLCGFVDDDVIAESLTDTSRDEAMDRLVGAAHQAGGLDNITIIIADVIDVESVDLDATAVHAPIDVDQSEGSTHRVGGPIDQPQIIGAAAERDIPTYEEEIRERVAQRSADAADEDDDFDEADEAYDDEDEPEDEDRYDPQPPSRRRWRRPLILTLAVLLIVAAAAGAGLAWIRTQYYVGAASSNVAIYQGLNQSVLGVPLSRVYEVQDLPLDDLPAYYQGMVRETIDTGTLESARATVQQLQDTAERCAAEQPTPPAGSTSPKATPKSTSTAKSTSKPPKSPTTKSSPTKSTSPKATSSTHPSTSTSPTASGQLPGTEKC
ncbi:MAG TPA: protein phosphatase 2C domain-containing protein [Microlunatus sp.]